MLISLSSVLLSCGTTYEVKTNIVKQGGSCVYVLELQKNVLARLTPYIEQCSSVCKIRFYGETDKLVLVPKTYFLEQQRACALCWEKLKILSSSISKLTGEAYKEEQKEQNKTSSLSGSGLNH
jgi:hypothetical protein